MDDETANVKSTRSVAITILGALIVIVAAALFVWGLAYKPAYGAVRQANAAITTSTTASGQKVHVIHLNIVQEVGVGPHADWLGYQTDTKTPHPGTIFDLPRNSLVTVIVHNFDSATALRNPYFTLVEGTVGGVEYVNGKPVKVMNPNVTSHTFTIPSFGVTVPMMGVSDNAKPTDYQTMKFTFKTPNKKGVFRWQCIVPCGSGTYGNGGPMSELGYMQGLFILS